jgi:hypothetical protein
VEHGATCVLLPVRPEPCRYTADALLQILHVGEPRFFEVAGELTCTSAADPSTLEKSKMILERAVPLFCGGAPK